MKLIIDTDPGIDDAMAILYAALVPEIDLLGLTTVFGNVTVEIATRNALRLVEMAQLDIPVAQGAPGPLRRPYNAPSSEVHGKEGFGDVPAQAPNGRKIGEPAPAYLCRMARKYPGQITICAIGPITNIAKAIVLDREFANNIGKIVFMGGAAFEAGNVTQYAEANTYNDPHALNLVLAADIDCLMVGLDVTMQVLFTAKDFDELARRSPILGGFLRQASHYYLTFYRDVPKLDGCGLHDAMAVIACTNPELFDIARHKVSVVEDGERIGQTQVDAANGGGHVTGICCGGDMTVVHQKFIAAFGNACEDITNS